MPRPLTNAERTRLYRLRKKIGCERASESVYDIYEKLKAKIPRTPSDRTKLYRLRKKLECAAQLQLQSQPQNEPEDCSERGKYVCKLRTKTPLSGAERSRRYRQKKKAERAIAAQNCSEIKIESPFTVDESLQQCKLEKEDYYPDDEAKVQRFTSTESYPLSKQEKEDEYPLTETKIPFTTAAERIVFYIQTKDNARVDATQNVGESKIKRPLSGAERNRLYRQRKKIELEGMKIKKVPLTGAERSKRYRQRKKGVFVDVSWPNISVGHPLVDAVIDVRSSNETYNDEEPLIPCIFFNPTPPDPLSTSSIRDFR